MIGTVKVWVDDLQSSDSRLHKEEVLKKLLALAVLEESTAIHVLDNIVNCYNPFMTYGVSKTVPKTKDIPVTQAEAHTEWELLLRRLILKEITGNAAIAEMNRVSQLFNSDDWNNFYSAILLKDLRCGISEKTINKILGKTRWKIPTFTCQLATDCEKRPEMSGVRRIERKLDGVRVLAHVSLTKYPVLYSRNGKTFDNFIEIEQQLWDNRAEIYSKLKLNSTNGVILDGEIVSDSFQSLMRQAHRKKNVDTADSVFWVFDMIPFDSFCEGHYNAQQYKRLKNLEQLESLLDNQCPNIKIMNGLTVDLDTSTGRDQFERYSRDAIEQGFEGVMIKNLDAPYESRRGTAWLKWKPTITVDLEVIAIEEGTGKNVGRLGALVCHGTDQGREITVNCGSGFSDSNRVDIWNNRDLVIGTTVEVMADVVSKNQDGTYSLRFPRFVRFRDDK